ncbi:MAG: winged helix-turn-helix domain-containing protein, partial [Clostridiales bacterium]
TKLKRAVIKEEFVAITGNVITALILNQIIYWSERIRDFDKFIDEEKKRFENEGQEVQIDLQKGWIYKSYDELKEELMLTESLKTISRHVNKLVDLGFLDRRRNPKIRYDRTYQYRVDLLTIKNKLNEMGYDLQGYRVEFTKGQNVQSNCQKNSFEKDICPINRQIDDSKGQIDDSKGQYDASNRQIDASNCQIDKAIPEITTEITTENISKASTTKENFDIKEDVDVIKNVTMILKSIENKYLSISGKKLNSTDLNIIIEILNYPLKTHIDITTKEVLIIDTAMRIHKEFKNKNPGRDIHSFRYYFNAIIDEFRKLDTLRSERKNEFQSNNKREGTKTNGSTRKYDFTLLTTNRSGV